MTYNVNVQHSGMKIQILSYDEGGNKVFWGHFMSGQHPTISEKAWFEQIRNDWGSNNGEHGDPAWRDIKYPKTGLQ